MPGVLAGSLLVFIPAVVLFAHLVSAYWAAGLGGVYLVGRVLYFLSYIKDPKTRGLGFGLTMLPNLALIVGTLVAAVRGLLA
jgi:uncharacterized MAPEG superfamily protein